MRRKPGAALARPLAQLALASEQMDAALAGTLRSKSSFRMTALRFVRGLLPYGLEGCDRSARRQSGLSEFARRSGSIRWGGSK